MNFRLTRLSDIDDIVGMVDQARKSLKLLGVDQWQQGYPFRETFEQDCVREESYVMENDKGCVIGTLMLSFEGEPIYDYIEGAWLTQSSSACARYAVIHRVTTCSQNKEPGTASFGFSQAEQRVRAQGFESIRIDTHEDNLPMKKLLTKCGYVECGAVYLENSQDGGSKRIAFEKII